MKRNLLWVSALALTVAVLVTGFLAESQLMDAQVEAAVKGQPSLSTTLAQARAWVRFTVVGAGLLVVLGAFILSRSERGRSSERDPEAPEHRRAESDIRSGLLSLAQALSAARDSGTVFEIAMSVGAALSGCPRSAIVTCCASGGRLTVAAHHGFDNATEVARLPGFEHLLREAGRSRLASFPPGAIGSRIEAPLSGGVEIVGVLPLLCGHEQLGLFVLASDAKQAARVDSEVATVVAELTGTALKNAQLFEDLRSSEARYLDLYDNAPDLYQTIDTIGRVQNCNSAQSLTLGYSKNELVGREFDSLLADESVSAWPGMCERLFLDGFIRGASLKLRSKDGKPVEVLLNASVIRGPEGVAHNARMVMRDVTEVRRLEHQLRQSQKLEVVGALAGGIAHDFNNVLGGILGYASLLRSELKERPIGSKYVDVIERSAVRGAELTGKLLAASRKTPMRREPVRVNAVVEETLDLLAHTFHKNVKISKRLDVSARPMIADFSQLQQVVLNLCVNARDAMPEGGELVVETFVDETSNKLRLSVEDSGVGIEPAVLEHLFEPFFSTKGDAGTGLGLSVVYGIVKSLGGDVRVKSAPGRGARFDVHLPIQWAETRVSPMERREAVHGKGQLILLVDDEPVLRELGKEILETHGYHVHTVGGGEEALSFLRETRGSIALVILDLVMPGLDGNETYRELRRLDPAVPVLLSSGLTAEESVREILEDGASGFVPKPYGIGELTQAVDAALRMN